jgi:Fe-S-cluster containining protein
MDAEHILTEARESISLFCMQECKAYCCRKGYLVLTSKEAVLVSGHPLSTKDDALRDVVGGGHALHLGETHAGCPCLKDFKCTIHTDVSRPKTCKDFPIFRQGNVVRFSPRCPAVQAGKMYQVEHELMQLGFEISNKETF